MNPTPILDKDIEAIVLVFIVIRANLNQWVMVQNAFIQQRVMVTRVSYPKVVSGQAGGTVPVVESPA